MAKDASPVSAPQNPADAKLPSFTWEEVAAHNCEATGVWISVDDYVYAIPPSFYTQHPGGKEYILLAAGRDCTDLMASYHPFTSKPWAVLKNFRIGVLSSRQYPKFKPDNSFYPELCRRVGAYFKDNKIDEKSTNASVIRMSGMMVIYVFSYLACMTPYWDSFYASLPAPLAALLRAVSAVLLGWSQVMFLLHIMHDCSHSAFGHSEGLWKLGGRMFSETIVGSSMVCWQNQHVIGHHIYTNVQSIDPDLPMARDGDMRLITPQQNMAWIYRYQHIYLLPLYGLFTFKSRVQDIQIFLERLNGPIAVNPPTMTQWIRLICSKLIYVMLRVVIPLMVLQSWRDWAVLSFLCEVTSGLYLALNFQVSHVSTAAVFPVAALIPASPSYPVDVPASRRKDATYVHPFTSKELDKEPEGGVDKITMAKLAKEDKTNTKFMWDLGWAELQALTSVDYAHDSPLCTFMCGALNYQTIHHLFPTVSQYHYPAITPIVRKVCEEQGKRYNYIPTFWEALIGHVEHLKEMGNKGIFCYPDMD